MYKKMMATSSLLYAAMAGCAMENSNTTENINTPQAAITKSMLENPHNVDKSQQPNILFIFADDMTYEALASAPDADSLFVTPNLDKLASRSTYYTHAYNQGSWSAAVCVASRTMLLTGQTVWHARDLAQEHPTWPLRLQDAGYHTQFVGKWHASSVGNPALHFNHVVPGTLRHGMHQIMPNNTPDAYNRPREGVEDTWNPADPSRGGYWRTDGTHDTTFLANKGIEVIQQWEETAEPDMLYLAFSAPHDPRQAPQAHLDLFPIDEVTVPDTFLPEHPYTNQIGCPHNLRDEFLAPMPRTEYHVQVHRSEYAAIMHHLDYEIGRVLDALEASGQLENTLIVFTADHGLAVGQHGLIGKQNMYEHSLRVPLLMSGPGWEAGTVKDTPVYLQQLTASTLQQVGGSIENMGFAPLPVDKEEGLEVVYGAYYGVQRMVRFEDWKLIWFPNVQDATANFELYDLSTDPREIQNLATLPAHAERLKKMKQVMIAEMERQNDKLFIEGTLPE